MQSMGWHSITKDALRRSSRKLGDCSELFQV
jgi:hypothetical protein